MGNPIIKVKTASVLPLLVNVHCFDCPIIMFDRL